MSMIPLKNKAFILIALLVVFFTSPARAELLGPSPALQNGMVLRGRFTEAHPIKGMTEPMRSEGAFVVAPGKGVIWRIEKPMAMTFVLTKGSMTQFIGTMPILTFSPEKIPFLNKAVPLLSAALGGNFNALRKDFTLIQSGTKAAWEIEAVPNERGVTPFQTLLVKGGARVNEAEATHRNGMKDLFAFTDQTVSKAPLSAEELTFFSAVAQKR